MSKQRLWVKLFAGVALIALADSSAACPFCASQGLTLTGESQQSQLVLFGQLVNLPKRQTHTDIVIDSVIKDHAARGGRQRLTLDRFLDTTLQQPQDRFLLFCLLHGNAFEPSRGVLLRADSTISDYLRQSLRLSNQSVGLRLRYFFDHLDQKDIEISNDAYKEFGNADYKDLRTMAADLPADRIEKWLGDARTPRIRFGLYGLMLGHCGGEKQAKVLRALLEDSQQNDVAGVDGLLAGYVMLAPVEGWKYLCEILRDSRREFTQRYAALRTVRFFFEYRPDVIPRPHLVEAISQMLTQSDIADLVIEDLRRRGQWERAVEVLDLFDRPSHRVPVIRRAIVDYALCGQDVAGPAQKHFVDFLGRVRQKEPKLLRDREEQHRREQFFALGPAHLLAGCLASQGNAPGTPLGAAASIFSAARVSQLNLFVPDPSASDPAPLIPVERPETPSATAPVQIHPSASRPTPGPKEVRSLPRKQPSSPTPDAGSNSPGRWQVLALLGVLAGLLLMARRWVSRSAV